MAWLPQWLKAESQESNPITIIVEDDTHSEPASEPDPERESESESQVQSVLRQSIDHEIAQRRQTWQETPHDPPTASKWRDSISSSSSSSVYSHHRETHTPRCLTPAQFPSYHYEPVVRKMPPREQREILDLKDFENVSLNESTRGDKLRVMRERKKAKREEERRKRDPEKYWDVWE